MIGTLQSLPSRLRKDQSGVAYIEFAYSLPLLMALCIYGVELANLAITHARVSQIASMTADNAARVRDRIDETDINEMFIGTILSGKGIKLTENGRVVISVLEDNEATPSDKTDQIITWQRCKGKKAPTTSYGEEGDILYNGIGTPDRRISASPGNPVIFVEVFYDYQPIISNKLFGPVTMHYSSAYSVRDRVDQTMQNAQNLSGSQQAKCTYYSA